MSEEQKSDAALINNLVPCAWLSSVALEVSTLQLRLLTSNIFLVFNLTYIRMITDVV